MVKQNIEFSSMGSFLSLFLLNKNKNKSAQQLACIVISSLLSSYISYTKSLIKRSCNEVQNQQHHFRSQKSKGILSIQNTENHHNWASICGWCCNFFSLWRRLRAPANDTVALQNLLSVWSWAHNWKNCSNDAESSFKTTKIKPQDYGQRKHS